MIRNILSIAGSDPSGGAGIQADIKAISANGGFAMAALTALTAQNTQGVHGINLVPPEFVQAQIKAVFDDIRVDAVKIGMIAKGGAPLLHPDAIAKIKDVLLPMATILTPNLPEAAHLLGADVATTRCDMERQGTALCQLGPKAVLMKGGHLNSADSPDCLIIAETITWFEGTRTPTHNTHGTGCTLSSALATQLAITGDISTAVTAAKAYVAHAIADADLLNVGSGHGPTHHFAHLFPKTRNAHS